MNNVIIIGAGPAGVSAALYAVRAGIVTTVIAKGSGALDKAERVENYYGLAVPVSGAELERRGIDGAKRLGVEFIQAEAVGLSFDNTLLVQTNNGDYKAGSVVIATGVARSAPKIKGLVNYEGAGVSYCAVCDAFFYRGKDVAVLGDGEYALHEATTLNAVANSVTLLTNGSQPVIDFPRGISVVTTPVAELAGADKLERVNFVDGSAMAVSGVFVAHGVAGSTALARKIGAVTEANRIVVDDKMMTNVGGLFAAGDCTGGMLQIAKAVYEGAVAGMEAAKYVRRL